MWLLLLTLHILLFLSIAVMLDLHRVCVLRRKLLSRYNCVYVSQPLTFCYSIQYSFCDSKKYKRLITGQNNIVETIQLCLIVPYSHGKSLFSILRVHDSKRNTFMRYSEIICQLKYSNRFSINYSSRHLLAQLTQWHATTSMIF